MVKLGQNFLTCNPLAERIVNMFHPKSKVIVEVGPGEGILTSFLLKKFRDEEIILIELDKKLADELKTKFSNHSIQIFNTNILKVDLLSISKGRSVSIIANLPYYISKKFFDWLISYYDLISDGVILVQKEFAEKLLLKNPNAQAIIFNCLFSLKKLLTIGPAYFTPRPKVESTLISLKKNYPIIDYGQCERFYAFLKMSFQQRRKTLGSNLKNLLKNSCFQNDPSFRRRAEELSPQEFYALFLKIQNNLEQGD